MCANTIHEFAPAKLNLYLHILGRREDGYHNLDSLVVFADVGDNLNVGKSSTYSFELTGPFAAELMANTSEPNLVLQAADVVAHCVKEIPPGAEIFLEKNLPVSSGIGGGSSDAAACIRGLLKIHNQKLSDIARQQIALAVGSDVSVCLLAKAARMRGAGHSVEPYSGLISLHAVLVNPGIKVSTAEIFAQLNMNKGEKTETEEVNLPKKLSSIEDWCGFLENTRNDLQQIAISQEPVVEKVLERLALLPGCLFSRMSGSGATCFGLFASREATQKAAKAMAEEHPEWWVKETILR